MNDQVAEIVVMASKQAMWMIFGLSVYRAVVTKYAVWFGISGMLLGVALRNGL